MVVKQTLLAAVTALSLLSCSDKAPDDLLERTALSYLAKPTFSSTDFMEQLTGTNAELELVDRQNGQLYFSYPRSEGDLAKLKSLSVNPDAIEYGQTSTGAHVGSIVKLGDYVLQKPNTLFFRMPVDDFKVDPNTTFTFPFSQAKYEISLTELSSVISDETVYGGKLWAIKDSRTKMADHGRFVAKNDPSLERLVSQITQSPDESVRAQDILDFVTTDLKYLKSDADQSYEILKRANETLMTGGSDCGGLTITLASLYNHANVDCTIFYGAHHATVGVKSEFQNFNGLSFTVNGETYSIAEPTVPGFKIGKTKIYLSPTEFTHSQELGEPIVDLQSGKPVDYQ